jgi:hypothetical protein
MIVEVAKVTKHKPARIVLTDGREYDLDGYHRRGVGSGAGYLRLLLPGETEEIVAEHMAALKAQRPEASEQQKREQQERLDTALAYNQDGLRDYKVLATGVGNVYALDLYNRQGELTSFLLMVEAAKDLDWGEDKPVEREGVRLQVVGFKREYSHLSGFSTSMGGNFCRNLQEAMAQLTYQNW